MSSFHEKAAAAASRIAAASSSFSPEESMSRSLAQDRPTIDAAVKSYLSLISARSLSQATLDHQDKCAMSNQDALASCRVLLQAINRYTFALEKSESLERSVTAQLWNGLVASNQKPSRFLGRRALAWAYDDLDFRFPEQVDKEQAKLFQSEFGSLLQYTPNDSDTTDNDAALLWDADGGKNELAKRRQRRSKQAAKRQEKPMIEELDDTEET